jgi:hypothetical protein
MTAPAEGVQTQDVTNELSTWSNAERSFYLHWHRLPKPCVLRYLGTDLENEVVMERNQEFLELADDPDLIVCVEPGKGACRAYLGDKAHGYIRMETLSSFAAAVSWLQHSAHQYYPHSHYALRHPVIQ